MKSVIWRGDYHANKPVSIAQQAVLDGKLDKSGGTMTGDLTVSNGRGIIATFVVLDQAQPVNATDAAPKAYVDRKSGVGRTWQDVTSQRIKSTNYVNNTGRDIIVAVRRNSSGNNSLGIWINGQQILDIYKWDSDPRTNYGSVTVPDGATYSLYWDGNNQMVWELR